MDVIIPIWFVSCDSRYMSISICHEMSQVLLKDMKIYLLTNKRNLQDWIFNSSCVLKLWSWEFLLSRPLQWTPKCKILQLYIFRFFTVKRRRNFAKHFMIHTKAKSCLLKIGEWSSSLPGVSGWHLKWNFRKLCQHLFNLSSCETSSISHNPLSSYYCCWISSSVVCKMKLHLWILMPSFFKSWCSKTDNILQGSILFNPESICKFYCIAC